MASARRAQPRELTVAALVVAELAVEACRRRGPCKVCVGTRGDGAGCLGAPREASSESCPPRITTQLHGFKPMRSLRLSSSRPHLRAMPRASQRRAPLRRLWLPISQSARVANGALSGSAGARAVSVLETSGNQGGVERHVPAAHHNATPRLHTYAALVTAELQISSPSDLTRIATARAHASNNAPAQARPSKPVVAPMPMAWAASSPPSFARTRPRPRRRSPPTSLARAVKGPRAQQRVSAGDENPWCPRHGLV